MCVASVGKGAERHLDPWPCSANICDSVLGGILGGIMPAVQVTDILIRRPQRRSPCQGMFAREIKRENFNHVI